MARTPPQLTAKAAACTGPSFIASYPAGDDEVMSWSPVEVGREIRAELRRAGGHGRDQGRPVGQVDLPDINPGPRAGQFRNDSRHRRPAPAQRKQVEPASGEPPGQRRPEIGSPRR